MFLDIVLICLSLHQNHRGRKDYGNGSLRAILPAGATVPALIGVPGIGDAFAVFFLHVDDITHALFASSATGALLMINDGRHLFPFAFPSLGQDPL
jgi:hypothetical protein